MSVQTVVNILLDVQLALAAMGALAVVTLAVWDLYVHLERPWAARARRWFDVYKYAAIGFGAVVLAGPWLAGKLTGWFRDGTLPADGSIALIIASAALFVAALRARPTTVGKLKYTLLFPPWWVAALLAQLFAWGYWQAFPASWQALMPGDDGWGLTLVILSTFTGTCVVVGGLLLWDKWRALDGKVSKASKRSIEDWLRDDKPIESAADDKFGHTAIAQRIAKRLASEEGASAIAVIGGFGSGKSSVRNLTIEELKDKPWVVVVPVSAWLYESASALVTDILERIAGQLAGEAGGESLRHVPARYREAVEGITGGWGKLLRIFERPRAPDDVLREIDDIALALRVRIVVWVEDLERYAPVPDDELRESAAVREKLEPVRALLHQLQELQNVTIVVATTRIDTGFDLEKLARYIEILPALSREYILRQLHQARSEAMEAFTTGELVDSVSPEQRDSLDLRPDRPPRAIMSHMGPTSSDWVNALITLSPTPRTIKQGLRDFREIWNELAGEIDVDHALGASILRHSEAAVFAALVNRPDALRAQRFDNSWRHGPSKEQDAFFERLVQEAGVRVERREAVSNLLQLLFGNRAKEHSQGFSHVVVTDYWERYLSGAQIDKEEGDQIVLQALRQFAADGSGQLLSISMQSRFHSKIRAFASVLPTPKVLDLLDAQLAWSCRKQTVWPHDQAPDWLTSTYLMCRRRVKRGDWEQGPFFIVINRNVDALVRAHNLRLADGLFQIGWADGFLSPRQRECLRETFVDALIGTFRDEPAALALSVRDVEAWLLYRLCYGPDADFSAFVEAPFARWSEFASTLFVATRQHPHELLPQLAWFLTGGSPTEGGSEAAVDFNALSGLFPGMDVLSLYAQHAEVASADPKTQARLDALRAAALAQKPTDGT